MYVSRATVLRCPIYAQLVGPHASYRPAHISDSRPSMSSLSSGRSTCHSLCNVIDHITNHLLGHISHAHIRPSRDSLYNYQANPCDLNSASTSGNPSSLPLARMVGCLPFRNTKVATSTRSCSVTASALAHISSTVTLYPCACTCLARSSTCRSTPNQSTNNRI